MLNFIHYTNIFGYKTTQLFTMLFPSQFFIYNYPELFIYNYNSLRLSCRQ